MIVFIFGFLGELLDASLHDDHNLRHGFWDWRWRRRCACGTPVRLHGVYTMQPGADWICPVCAAPASVVTHAIGRRFYGAWEWKPPAT